MTKTSALENRMTECMGCFAEGYIVDTTAGEIIERGVVVAVAPRGAMLLMARNDGSANSGDPLCDYCAAVSR